MLPVGHQFGHYQINRLLGKGGMGEVYEAEDLESGRVVALKILHERMDSEKDRQRFLREGRLAAQVSHPNVVYVFGTEEIEGVQCISMEFVPSGTLKEVVNSTFLFHPVRKAVDAILQVIEGLEAAHAKGVLHRDIKPSNCFVDAEGNVKIGDFGLSISTLAKDETQLTASGSFLGTPAFASPEQILGKEVDVRSDIYSVGTVLYFMLTGRLPFEARNPVQLVSRVLADKPRPPHLRRPGIPKGLSQLILKCLSKEPRYRFAHYSDLRNDLARYGTAVIRFASLRSRFGAGLIDQMLFVFGALITWSVLANPVSMDFHWTSFLAMLYYTITEGVWGCSLGKAVIGLRVIGPDRGTPSLSRSLVRSSCFILFLELVGLIMGPIREASPSGQSMLLFTGLNILRIGIPILLFGLIFATARKRNGWAGLHELISDSRVVQAKGLEERHRLPAQPMRPVKANGQIGPYRITGEITRKDDERLILARDPDLQREVWVHVRDRRAPVLTNWRRDLDRPGRLRWLNAKREESQSWDAYEALSGWPLLRLITRDQSGGGALSGQPWHHVRYWFQDLAVELLASLDDPLPRTPLSMERVWVTAEGRAKLVDTLPPIVEGQPPGPQEISLANIQPFLNRVGCSALEGRVCGPRRKGPNAPVPISLREFFKDLSRSTVKTPSQLLEKLEKLFHQDAVLSPARRLGP